MPEMPSPPHTRIDTVVDEMHGHQIPDPYRWLEDGGSDETAEWVTAQNQYTEALLEAIPERPSIHRRLTTLLSIGTLSAPAVRHGRHFFTRRQGDQNQPVLFVRDTQPNSQRVLLDPNTTGAAGTVALDWWYPSPDGALLAYGYSSNGNEWSTLHVLDVESGELLPDRIPRTRAASVAWLPDGSGLYYTRYPTPGTVPEGEEYYRRRLYLHLLGTDPAADPLVFGEEVGKEDWLWARLSDNGRWLAVMVSRGPSSTDLYLRDLSLPDGTFVLLTEASEALFDVDFAGDTVFILTNLEAPRYRLLRVPAATPQQTHWEEIIAESPDAVLESITLAGGNILAGYLRYALSTVSMHAADGTKIRDIDPPGSGTVTAIRGEWESSDAFYSFESYTVPPTVYRLDTGSGESTVWDRVDAPLTPDDYAVTQHWYPSRDGTRVSMFIVHRKDLDRSQPHPTVLTGYGGFNVSLTPLFDRGLYLWLEKGGVYAVPNLRGGSEYGEAWHRDGRLDRKQNVFDDFTAAAEYLIQQGYTDRSHLAISGGSNGGLLVGAALTQRPDLFRAVVCAVPLLDMLRYHHFLLARLWIPEYGSADDPVQFAFLRAYSPYQQVRNGVEYPAVLLTTAESDSRVDPLHARKMAARLQAASVSTHPILLRVESQAGHGIGKPLTKVIEEQTDVWSFLFWQLGVTLTSRSRTRSRARSDRQ